MVRLSVARPIRCGHRITLRLRNERILARHSMLGCRCDPINHGPRHCMEVELMWILFLLFGLAFAAVTLKYMTLQIRHQNKTREYTTLVKEYNNVVGLAQKMDIQLGAMHEKNRQLMLRNTPEPDIDQGLVKELIAFCHPDKHQGSEKANRLTQKLLKIRK